MILLTTAEVRWFFPGEIPSEVMVWYQSVAGHPQPQPERTDYYLPAPGADSTNIKYREGRVEIKQRYDQTGPVVFGESASGTVEIWQKWGFELAEQPAAFGDLAAWIAVRKVRLLRNYEIQAGSVVPIPAEARRERSCAVELTRVHVKAAAWWTLALEAVGPEETLSASLRTTAHHVLAGARMPHLTAQASFGYAQWLLGVAAPFVPGC